MRYKKFLIQLNDLIEQTNRYVPPNARRSDMGDNYDRYVDFPYIEDPDGYQTYRPIEQKEVDEQSSGSYVPGTAPKPEKSIAIEQDKAIDPAAAGADAGAETPSDVEDGMPADVASGEAPGMDANMDPNMGMDAGMDSMGGMPGQQEEELTSSQIGRVYELKKIYARLSSVETYLSRATDESILDLRKYVAQSINLFEVVISNYKQFKDNVDDIIVQFYEFLDVIYSSLRKYYKEMKDIKTSRS